MFEFIYVLLGTVMKFIYGLIQNFGFSIIAFTVLVRLCMLPLVIKQQKSMAHMQKIQPALQELQKKYQYDKEKLNEETVKLYQQNKINPMSSCLPLLIQMPILFAVYGIIQNPATYILQPGAQGITAAMTALMNGTEALAAHATQLDVVAWVSNNVAEAGTILANAGSAFTANSFYMNFNFLGLNLGFTPGAVAMTEPVYWTFPIIAALTTFLTSYISQKMAKTQTEEQASQAKTMQFIFPLMTGYFCYILPAAMGLYWIVGNILQIIQSFTLDRYVVRKEANEIAVKEEAKRLEKKENKKKKKK